MLADEYADLILYRNFSIDFCKIRFFSFLNVRCNFCKLEQKNVLRLKKIVMPADVISFLVVYSPADDCFFAK